MFIVFQNIIFMGCTTIDTNVQVKMFVTFYNICDICCIYIVAFISKSKSSINLKSVGDSLGV